MSEDKRQNKLWLAIGLGCGIPLGLMVLLIFGGIIFLSFGPEGGVRLANNMEDYALEYIQEQGLLNEGEDIVAYYDVTTGLNSSEAAILTDARLVYHKDGRNQAINLSDITQIEEEGDGIGGTVIQVFSATGDIMVVEIAPLNQGPLFLNALKNKVEGIQGSSPASP